MLLCVFGCLCVFSAHKTMTSDTLLAPVNHLHTHTLTNVMICGVITRKCQFHAPLYMKTFMGLLFPYQLLVTVLPVRLCTQTHKLNYTQKPNTTFVDDIKIHRGAVRWKYLDEMILGMSHPHTFI